MGAPEAAKGGLPAALRWGLKIAVTLALALWLATLVDTERLAEVFTRMEARWWAALAGLMLLTLVLHAWRWQLVLRALGERPRLFDLFGDVMVGMTYNLVLPTTVGGDLMRAYRAGRRLEHHHHAWSSSVYERLAGFVATALCALAAVLATGGVFGPALWAVLCISAVLSVAFWRAEAPARWVAKIASRIGGAPARITEDIRADFEGPLSGGGIRVWTLLLSLAGIFMVVFFGWCSAWALGVQRAELAIAVAMPVAQLTSAIPVSINGLGLREGTIVLVLAAYGFDDTFALSLALLFLAGVLFAGAVGLLFVAFTSAPAPQAETEPEA